MKFSLSSTVFIVSDDLFTSDIDTYGGQWLVEKDIEKSQHVTKS
jgi:hypothetical protein